MKTLLESENYTKEKKKQQLGKLEKSHYIRPTAIFNDYLNNTLTMKSTVALNLEYLSSWYLWKYIDDYIEKDNTNYLYLAQSTYYSYHGNLLNYLIGKIAPKYDSSILFRTTVMNLAQMLLLGWDELAIHYGKILIDMLGGKFYKGGLSKPLYTWFIIELFCKWQNISLDKSNLNYPDSLNIYENALDNLYSVDEKVINKIIDELVDFHIKNSDEYVKTDKDGNEFSAEFVSCDYFIFPMEILMYLSIRKRLGLPNYNNSNELLSLKVNRLPNFKIDYQKDGIIEAIFEKIYKENSELKLKKIL